MIKNFDEVIAEAKRISQSRKRPVRVAVAAGNDEAAIEAIYKAKKMKFMDGILVGEKQLIVDTLQRMEIDKNEFEIIDQSGEREICQRTIQTIHDGEAEIVLKGKVKTPVLIKEVLNPDKGLRTGNLISDEFVFEWLGRPGENKLLIITDGGFILKPDLTQKVQLIENAVKVMHALGNENPKVAVLSAVETINPDLDSTIDAAVLSKMNQRGQIKGCIVDGPFALDNAIYPAAAKMKNINSPVAGQADILLCPNIESANMLAKGTTYFSKFRLAHATMGAKSPVLIPSRSDTSDAKMLTLALNVIICTEMC